MAERQLPKLNVAGSIPVSRSNRINSIRKHSKNCPPLEHHLHYPQTFLRLIDRNLPVGIGNSVYTF